MLGTCSAVVRLQSRVTSSGATVRCVCFLFVLLLLIVFLFCFIKFLFIYVFIFYFLSLACLFCLFLFCGCCCCCLCVCVCVCVYTFKFIYIFPSLFILCEVFISLRVGLGLFFCWSETEISYFGVVYKNFWAWVWNGLKLTNYLLFCTFNMYIFFE